MLIEGDGRPEYHTSQGRHVTLPCQMDELRLIVELMERMEWKRANDEQWMTAEAELNEDLIEADRNASRRTQTTRRASKSQ